MTMVRFNPFSELNRLHRDFDGVFGLSRARCTSNECDTTYDWTPSIDIYEEADATVLTVMLAGLDRKDVQVNIENRVLTISGEREQSRETTDEHFSRVESSYGKFFRSFKLPAAFDLDKVEASMDKGVLTVTLPKREEAKPKQISVNIN